MGFRVMEAAFERAVAKEKFPAEELDRMRRRRAIYKERARLRREREREREYKERTVAEKANGEASTSDN